MARLKQRRFWVLRGFMPLRTNCQASLGLRAKPRLSVAMGLDPVAIRYAAVALSEALAGLGAAFLSISATGVFITLPYVLTIVVLPVSTTRSGAPAALGQPYEKGER